MSILCCPVCKGFLSRDEKIYRCPKGHCYDLAKQGYVNLLQSQRSSSRNHGDDRAMITARRDFLEKGYYAPLKAALQEKVYFYTAKNAVIADAGCGEGWYTEGLADRKVVGFDISKEALKWAAKREGFLHLAVASCYDLPMAEGSADGVINFFSPLADQEYARVLKKGGKLFRAVPQEKHLWELKQAVYETPIPNRPEREELAGMRLIERVPVSAVITLKSNDEIQTLFQMTPYYYRTSPQDRAKLQALDTLTVRTEFMLLIYTKE